MKNFSTKQSTHTLCILFVLLACFIGQSVATTFSCQNMSLPSNTTKTLSMADCHEATQSNTLLDANNKNISNNCEENCHCCVKICASTLLFLSSFSAQKSIEASIPFFVENIFTVNINSLYRPPIT